VLAPDWQGFGRSGWRGDGYWFHDYVADLDALLRTLSPDAPVHLVGHSLGANVSMIYAGVRAARVRSVVALDGFGIPAEDAALAPRKMTKWLDALAHPDGLRPYPGLGAVADRLQKNNPRLPRDKAEYLAAHWAEELPDGGAMLRADPRHKLPFPTVYRMEEIYAVWRKITAPVLWVAAEQSEIHTWLAGGGDGRAEIERRCAKVPQARLEIVGDAGHMLHHDQPAAVAKLLEAFLPA
jgi:pimeloyl-ACP methyl ester carboxylesterase